MAGTLPCSSPRLPPRLPTACRWAYPSGIEDEREPWISGPMMVMVTVIMNMVYLTTETRTRVGEPGINDPNIKIAVTCVTFFQDVSPEKSIVYASIPSTSVT